MIEFVFNCGTNEYCNNQKIFFIPHQNKEKNVDITGKLILFISENSIEAFIGIVLDSTKLLFKRISNINQLEVNTYEIILENSLVDEFTEINRETKLDFTVTIDNEIEYLEICKAISEKEVLFRGQSNFKYGLEPSIFRNDYNEEKEIKLYKDIVQWNLEQFSSGDFLKDTCNMQHYGIPTRLLDWTTNPLHALYFACVSPRNQEKDGQVICVRPNDILDIDSNECSKINTFLEYRFTHNINNANILSENDFETMIGIINSEKKCRK